MNALKLCGACAQREAQSLLKGKVGFVLCDKCAGERATVAGPAAVNSLQVMLRALDHYQDYGLHREFKMQAEQARDHLLTIARRDWVVQVLDSAAQQAIVNTSGMRLAWPPADVREEWADRVWPLLPELERERIGVRP